MNILHDCYPRMRSFWLALFLCTAVWSLLDNCYAMGPSHPALMPDAVNLMVKKYYRVNSDGSYSLTLYFKTLINTYKGKKDRGDFRFAYNSAFETVEVKFARTVLPDGKSVEVSSKEINDIADPSTQRASIFSGARLRIINFPAVEKGCTIELKIVKHSRIGFWGLESFRLADPCRRKDVVIDLPDGALLSYHLKDKNISFSKKEEQGRRIFTWSGQDLKKVPDEPFSPFVENMASTLVFSSLASWQQVAAWFRQVLTGDSGDGRLEAIAKELDFAGGVDKLYCRLTKRLEILPIGLFDTKLAFQAPQTTLLSGYGSQIDAALLFYYVLKMKGLEPHLVMASSKGVWIKDLTDCPYPRYLDTLIVEAKNRFYSFDTKDLSPGITGMDGQLGLDLTNGQFVSIADVRPTSSISRYEVYIEDQSLLRYHFSTVRSGRSAQGMRQMFKDLTPDEFKVTSSIFFHSLNPLAIPASPLAISDLDPLAGPVRLLATFTVEDFVIKSGNFSVFIVPRISKLDAVAACPEKRKSPMFIRKNDSAAVEFTMVFPSSYEMAWVPRDIRGSMGPISWENCCNVSDSLVHCIRKVQIRRGFIRNGQEFRQLRQAISALLDPEANSLRVIPAP